MTIRKKIYNYLNPLESDPLPQKILNNFIAIIIIFNIFALIASSVKSVEDEYGKLLDIFEWFCITIFTIEYILRLYTIKENATFSRKNGRVKYFFTLPALIDLISILPIIFHLFNLSFIRVLRLARLVRVFKLERYTHGIQKIFRVFKNKKNDLISAFSLIIFVVIVFTFLIYLIENEAQPDKYSSIPESLYWTIVTITSIGGGDIFPVTLWGKLLTVLMALIGIAFVALPTSIITAGFIESKTTCPHCGKEF
jgi:voltage-gated potassium channel